MTMLPLALYALTGFAGLLAEQGFEKYLSLLVGATASASAVVIFAYFLGFALGSWAVGKTVRAGRIARPLRLYGILELLVGVSCVVFAYTFHPLVELLAPLQSQNAGPVLKFAIRFAFGAALILPSAALMGASFPLIAQVVDRDDESGGNRWTLAYSANLLGATLGALLGSYAVMPLLGVRGAFWLCCAIGGSVFIASRFYPDKTGRPAVSDDAREAFPAETWLLLAAAFASGLVFFALEVIWTHLIATTLGSSVYAFSSMLVMVLAGLLAGAARVRRMIRLGKTLEYSRLFQFAGFLLVCQFRLWDWVQSAFLIPLPAFLRNFYGVELFKLLMAAVLIVPPAALLGTIFPHLLRSPVLRRRGHSYLVGYLNTANSIGCLAGALGAVFVLIPALGSEISLKALAVLLLLVSLPFAWRENPTRKAMTRAVLGVALVTGYASYWHWDRRILTSGLNVYFGAMSPALTGTVAAAPPPSPSDPVAGATRLVYFHEHPQGGITTVLETKLEYAQRKRTELLHGLFSNGKFQGDDSVANEGNAQIGFSIIPSLFVNRFDRALLIGLGTGHSALALRESGYGNVDIAEFSPGIVEAASTEFAALNHNVLADPCVRLVLEDGRNMLLTDRKTTYDLITIELTSIWFAGATNLYSQEFYELASRRLRPGGVLQQWVQLHHIGPAELASAAATLHTVFPYVSLWFFGSQGMIVGSKHPQALDPARLARLAGVVGRLRGGGAGDLNVIGKELVESELANPEAVSRMIAAMHPVINTDHNRWIEYSTPRYNSSGFDWPAENLRVLRSFRQ